MRTARVLLAVAGVTCALTGGAIQAQWRAVDGSTVMVSTFAGSSPLTPLMFAYGLGYAGNGDLYLMDGSNNALRKLTPEGVLTTVAGGGTGSGNIDGGPGVGKIGISHGIAVASDGTVFFGQTLDHIVRKVTPDGVVTTIAGTTRAAGHTDGTGTAATFTSPSVMAVGPAGSLYVASGYAVRRIGADATVTTFAGSATQAGTADGTGQAARFLAIDGLAVDTSGNVYVSDRQVIRRISPLGEVTTLAGLSGSAGTTDGTGSAARFSLLGRMAFHAGSVLVQDAVTSTNPATCSIRQVTTAGVVTTHPRGLALCGQSLSVDGAGNIAIMDRFQGPFGNNTPVSVTSPTGVKTTLLSATAANLTDGTGDAMRFVTPLTAIIAVPDGHVFVGPVSATSSQERKQRIDGTRLVTNVQGNSRDVVRGFAVSSTGTIYSAQGCAIEGFRPNPVTPNGVLAVNPLVGNSTASGSTCGAVDANGTAARFQTPWGVAVSSSGVAFVADTGNHTIRRVGTDDTVTTFAGGVGSAGAADGNGTTARFNGPRGIVVDASGVVYVADTENHTIRRIAANGDVTTLAGTAGSAGAVNAAGSAARFSRPSGLALDLDGSIIVADTGNHAIRRVTTAGVVTTVAGTLGVAGLTEGDGTVARFRSPAAVTVDASGTIFVADTGNFKVRQILQTTAAAPVITMNPSNATVNGGSDATFTCTASGTPRPTFEWHVSTNGGATWVRQTNSTGYQNALTPQLTVPSVTPAMSGRQYRCQARGVSTTVNSAAATLTVTNYSFTVSPISLQFKGVRATPGGELAFVTQPQTVSFSYTAPSVPQWTVSVDQPWLQVTGGSGSGAGSFTVGIINPSSVLATGGYLTGTVTLSASNVGLQRTIPVILRLSDPQATPSPIGNFDTPVNGAQNLSGAIVVSGWAVDDIGIDRVEIWRDLAPGENTPPYTGPGPGNGRVFVANGLFGPGTRPDIETLYHTLHPKTDRGGWGYMLLTYGFPDRGNGTFTLRAFAYDVEGQYAELGAKTITVNNAAATKPFGTIDYPEQNGTVSGVYTANGWVLTPNVNGVPTCTFDHIVMELDSNEVYIPVTYGLSRPDVTSAFPGLSTSAAPGAAAAFDTRTFGNGLHTIGWLAYDTCGRGEGIGSRFITVSNNGSGDAVGRPAPDVRPAGLDTPVVERHMLRLEVMGRGELVWPTVAGATWTG